MLACGAGSNENPTTVSGGEGGSSAAVKAPAGPVPAALGQTLTVDSTLFGKGEQVVAYTVANGRGLKAPNSFDKPENGTFYGVDLTVEVKTGMSFACGQDISFVAKDGTVYEPGFTTHKGTFDCADLGKGQRKAGMVVFDVPKDAPTGGRIQVKSLWDDEPYGYWTL
ncbi:MAG TPA: DUF1942 domain-containing protein [Candidatus Limnocylindrales bacterium]